MSRRSYRVANRAAQHERSSQFARAKFMPILGEGRLLRQGYAKRLFLVTQGHDLDTWRIKHDPHTCAHVCMQKGLFARSGIWFGPPGVQIISLGVRGQSFCSPLVLKSSSSSSMLVGIFFGYHAPEGIVCAGWFPCIQVSIRCPSLCFEFNIWSYTPLRGVS
jgi:hypothetical protein